MTEDLYRLFVPALICFEGDDDDLSAEAAAAAAEVAEAEAEAAAAAEKAAAAKAKAKLFDDPAQQAKFNAAIAEERRKLEKKNREQLEKMEAKLNEALESKTLTEQDRAKLEETLEDTRKLLRTEKENLKNEFKKEKDKYEAELALLKSRAESAEKRYENSTIDRALLDAAVEGGAFNAEILVTVLKGQAKLTDDGVLIDSSLPGKLKPTDDAGQPIEQSWTPEAAVKWMKDQPQYGGLFKSNVVSGVGGTSGVQPGVGKDGKVDVRKLTTEQYMEMRRKNPAALGL